MFIQKNTVVTLTYSLRIENGEIVDAATEDSPFVFIHGIGQTLPHFDMNLDKLESGDDFDFRISAENAYGLSNEEFVIPVPRSVFSGPDVPSDLLEAGKMVPMQDENGQQMNGVILSFDDEKVVIDFNHPLSGKDLHFTGSIISIREASEEELQHGHVHGPGGHHH